MEKNIPKFVKCPFGNFKRFTSGKEYTVNNFQPHKEKGGSFETIDYEGDRRFCLLKDDCHINNKNWIIVKPQ